MVRYIGIGPKNNKKRGVAPVIATLLLVAIAVVGGTIIFTFSQGFFSSAQISGAPPIEAIAILGYDARTITELQSHDGNNMLINSGGNGNQNKEFDERIAVYLRSDSAQTIAISELSFGGTVYNYTTITGNTLTDWNDLVDLTPGKYSILTRSPDSILSLGAPVIQPGQTITFLIDLDNDLRVGRSTQFKMTTTNGGVFVGTIAVGQQLG
jgi:archaeal type IV pilus assembly protein PilA